MFVHHIDIDSAGVKFVVVFFVASLPLDVPHCQLVIKLRILCQNLYIEGISLSSQLSFMLYSFSTHVNHPTTINCRVRRVVPGFPKQIAVCRDVADLRFGRRLLQQSCLFLTTLLPRRFVLRGFRPRHQSPTRHTLIMIG